ncbi:MAG: hypothetical protein AB1726_04040 [Planctomycetota bacterium]
MRIRSLLLACAALGSLAATTGAQCFLPDNLDSANCCVPVSAVLPKPIPSFTLPSQGIC